MSTPLGQAGHPARSDRRLLRRAALVVALQTGAATAAVVAVVVALVYALSLEARDDAAERKLGAKAAAAVADPAAYDVDLATDEPVLADGLPAGCADDEVRAAVARAAADAGLAEGAQVGPLRASLCGVPAVLLRDVVDGQPITAALSFEEQQAETQRLAQLSLLAGLAGVLAAAVVGGLLAGRAVRPLGEALSAQRRFVADASHEMRTPVAVLLTRAQLLARGPTTDDDQRQELAQLVADARALGDVVDDMLLAAELQHRPVEPQPVDLARTAREVRDSFRATADDQGTDLVLDLPPGEAADGLVVRGSPTALRRALAALVDNALSFAGDGGRVAVSLQTDRHHVVLRVADDGPGLDPERAQDLARRWRRGTPDDGARAPGAGHLGLGLALASEVVEAHGGTLALDGRPGEGAVATVRLPSLSR